MPTENQSEPIRVQWKKELTSRDEVVLDEVVEMIKKILATEQRPS